MSTRFCKVCGTEITWPDIRRQDEEKRRHAEEAAAKAEALRVENLAAEQRLLELRRQQLEVSREADSLADREYRRRLAERSAAFRGTLAYVTGIAAAVAIAGGIVWLMVLRFGIGWAIFFILLFSPIWIIVLVCVIAMIRGGSKDDTSETGE